MEADVRDLFPTIIKGNYRQGALCALMKTQGAVVVNQQSEPVRYMREASELQPVLCVTHHCHNGQVSTSQLTFQGKKKEQNKDRLRPSFHRGDYITPCDLCDSSQ